MSPGATKTDPCTGLSTICPAFTSLQPPCGRHSEEQASGFSPLWAFPLPGGVSRHPWTHPLSTSPFFQGLSRPTRSLSTAQLVQPSGGLQASVISNIVLMKGQAKVSKDHGQGRLLDGQVFPRSCHVTVHFNRAISVSAADPAGCSLNSALCFSEREPFIDSSHAAKGSKGKLSTKFPLV